MMLCLVTLLLPKAIPWADGCLDAYGELPLNSKEVRPDALVAPKQKIEKVLVLDPKKDAPLADIREWKKLIDQIRFRSSPDTALIERIVLARKTSGAVGDTRLIRLCIGYVKTVVDDLRNTDCLSDTQHPKLFDTLRKTSIEIDFQGDPQTKYEAFIMAITRARYQSGKDSISWYDRLCKRYEKEYIFDFNRTLAYLGSGNWKQGSKFEDELLSNYPGEPTPVFYRMAKAARNREDTARTWATKYLAMETRQHKQFAINVARHVEKTGKMPPP